MLRAELLKVRSHRLPWVLEIVFVAVLLAVAVIAMLVDATNTADMGTIVAAVHYLLGALLAVILGAWMGGQEFRWGTWRVILGRDSRRTLHLLNKTAAAGIAVVTLSVTTYIVGMAAAVGLAAVAGKPGTVTGVLGAGAAALVAHIVWATVGFGIGVLSRSPAIGISVGLVYLLIAENLLAALEDVQPFLLNVLLSVLALELTAGSTIEAAEFGVQEISAVRAAITLVVFGVVLLGAAWATFVRRDVTS